MGAIGIAVVNGEAFDAGVASIPTPWSESFDDRWLYHQYFDCMIMVDTVADWGVPNFANITIDSKAMRKVDTGDVIVAVVENPTTSPFNFWMNFRIGVKLH